MAAELEKLAQDYKNNGLQNQGEILSDLAHSWSVTKKIPNVLPTSAEVGVNEESAVDYIANLARQIADGDSIAQYNLIVTLNLIRTGKSKQKLAEELNISPNSLSRTLQGSRNPGPLVLMGMGRIFQIPNGVVTNLVDRFNRKRFTRR
jgi:hypothetical protein